MKVIAQPTVEPITLDTVRLQANIEDEVPDALLALYLGSAREAAEAFLGFKIAPWTVESIYATFPTASLPLEATPVLAVVSITYDDALGVAQTLPTSVYGFDSVSGAVTLLTAWPLNATNVRVRYVIGYSTETDSTQIAPLPRSIAVALLLTTAHYCANREATSSADLKSIPMGFEYSLAPYRTRLGFA